MSHNLLASAGRLSHNRPTIHQHFLSLTSFLWAAKSGGCTQREGYKVYMVNRRRCLMEDQQERKKKEKKRKKRKKKKGKRGKH